MANIAISDIHSAEFYLFSIPNVYLKEIDNPLHIYGGEKTAGELVKKYVFLSLLASVYFPNVY